jgi:hypothetical protein
MLKRPSDLTAQSNIKAFPRASDAYRSLQYFCNYQSSAINCQYQASNWQLDLSASFAAGY